MAATKLKHRRRSKESLVPLKGLEGKVQSVSSSIVRSDLPSFEAGDTVKVYTRIEEGEKKRIQVFEGIVLAKSHSGVNRSFTVRKVSCGIGIEKIFLESTPTLIKVEGVQYGRARRAKLYYLRNLTGRSAKLRVDLRRRARVRQQGS